MLPDGNFLGSTTCWPSSWAVFWPAASLSASRRAARQAPDIVAMIINKYRTVERQNPHLDFVIIGSALLVGMGISAVIYGFGRRVIYGRYDPAPAVEPASSSRTTTIRRSSTTSTAGVTLIDSRVVLQRASKSGGRARPMILHPPDPAEGSLGVPGAAARRHSSAAGARNRRALRRSPWPVRSSAWSASSAAASPRTIQTEARAPTAAARRCPLIPGSPELHVFRGTGRVRGRRHGGGRRSSVPLKHLQLAVVDEEHEVCQLQADGAARAAAAGDERPRLPAVLRADGAPEREARALLGSATGRPPSKRGSTPR